MQSFVLAPAPGMSEVVLEPYNSALCFQDLLEYTDQAPVVRCKTAKKNAQPLKV